MFSFAILLLFEFLLHVLGRKFVGVEKKKSKPKTLILARKQVIFCELL